MTTPPHHALTPERAQQFAASWYAAWNAHGIDAIMSHYAPEIEHSSPFIKRYNGTDDLWIKGIEGVRDYFARALQRNPTLRFDPPRLREPGTGLALPPWEAPSRASGIVRRCGRRLRVLVEEAVRPGCSSELTHRDALRLDSFSP